MCANGSLGMPDNEGESGGEAGATTLLTHYEWQTSYRSGRDNLAADFYAPAMAGSQLIQRTAGYFRSTVFALLYPQLSDFMVRGGRIELLCSPHLSPDDMDILAATLREAPDGEGSDIATATHLDDLSRSAFIREMQAMASEPHGQWHHSLLGGLLKYGFLDVRIALLRGGNGLFHEKLGLFHDAAGASMSFKGSVNETFSGWGLQGNIESMDVFCSWDEADAPRVADHQRDFNEVWHNRYPSVHTMTLDDAMRESVIQAAPDDPEEVTAMLAQYQRQRRLLIDNAGLGESAPDTDNEGDLNANESDLGVNEGDLAGNESDPDRWPSGRRAEPHQTKALTLWREAGKKGILAYATGSGKTFTALHAIRDHLREVGIALVTVPSRLLMQAWFSELTQEMPGITVIRAGDNHHQWRQPLVLEMCLSRPSPERPTVILATMQTAAMPEFWQRMRKAKKLLFVADEVHQLGSSHHRQVLNIRAGSNLGLSATPERFGDPEGTEIIMDYFQGVVGKPFTLADAMEAGRLAPYRYHPVTVSLNAEEADEWASLTDQLRRAIQRGPRDSDGKTQDNDRIRNLKIRRSRVAKKAAAKSRIPLDVLNEHYEPGQHWLVYCEDQDQLNETADAISAQGFRVWTYHSKMEGDRDATLASYRANSGIMVSIRCLDEGVDIPEISHAIILASSQNPRQFIQRRGRVLRRSPGKTRAEIWDALVIPPDMKNDVHGSLTRSELLRSMEFSEHASNQGGDVSHLRQMAAELGLSLDEIYGSEDDDADIVEG